MFDKIRYWLISKVFHWIIESRYRFIRLSEYRTLYIHYTWDNDDMWINLYDPTTNTKKHIFDLTLDRMGNVKSVKSKGVEVYKRDD